MNDYKAFTKRIQYIKQRVLDVAQELSASVKLPEKSRRLDQEIFLLFGIKSRGLPTIFRSVLGRALDVNVPVFRKINKKDIWVSGFERVCKEIEYTFNDSFEKAYTMTLGYLECLDILTGKKVDWTCFLRQVGFYFCLALNDELEEFLKYQTASLVALSLSNTPDVAPECVTRGRWKIGFFAPMLQRTAHWIHRVCVLKRTDKGVQLAFSLYTTKNIAPASTERYITKALEKNTKALAHDRKVRDRIDLADQMRRTVRELFHLATHPFKDFNTARTAADQRNKEIRSRRNMKTCSSCIPSMSACYERSRRLGGALGYLLERSGFKSPVCAAFASRILLGFTIRKDRFSTPKELYGVLCDEDIDEIVFPKYTVSSEDGIKPTSGERHFGYGLGSKVLVRREAILEPFKTRIISKGEAIPYQRAHNYQPFMWSLLQLANPFVLTGRPLQNEDINKILRFSKRRGLHSQIVSGDYSAATDNLHIWYSTVILEEICSLWNIPFEDALVLKQCLCGHIIDTREQADFRMFRETAPDVLQSLEDQEAIFRAFQKTSSYKRVREAYENDPNFVVKNDEEFTSSSYFIQKWGQLMGSFISFPILCIANFAVTRFSMEQSYGCHINMTDDALLVNGDDVLFTIPSGGYTKWVTNVTDTGLSPSIGKNFVSRRWAVINSQLYDCSNFWDYATVEVDVKVVPLVKMNLVHVGQHESCERTRGAAAFIGDALYRGGTLESRFEKLVEGWDGEVREKLLQYAYSYARPLLDLLPPVSWILPKCLGGLGLPMMKDQSVSLHHRKIATMIALLDEQTRRDVVRLTWLRQGSQLFCEMTNQQLNEIYDHHDVKVVLSTSQNNDPLYPKLLRSDLGYGLENNTPDPEDVIAQWKKMYSSWLKRIDKIRWIDFTKGPTILVGMKFNKDSETLEEVRHENRGMHLMAFEKMMTYSQGVWTRECPVYKS